MAETFAIDGEVVQVCFSADDRYLIAGTRGASFDQLHRRPGGGGVVSVWEVSTGTLVKSVRFDQWVIDLSPHPDGRRLLVACSNVNFEQEPTPNPEDDAGGEITILDLPGLAEVKRTKLEEPIGWTRYSPDGKTVATVLVHHWKKGESPNNRRPEHPDRIAILDADTLQARHMTGKPYDFASAFAFSHDSRWIYTVDISESTTPAIAQVRKIEVQSGKVSPSLSQEVAGTHMELSPDGSEILCTWGGIWTMDTRQETFTRFPSTLEAGEQTPGRGPVTYSPDGQSLLLARSWGRRRNARSNVLLADRQTKRITQVYQDSWRHIYFTSCAFAPDGKSFAVGTTPYRDTLESPFHGSVLLFKTGP